jgi:hypothetical protein
MTIAGVSKYELCTPGARHFQVSGSFVPNGTTQLTNTKGTDVFGMGFSIARQGVGVFRITFTVPFANVVSFVAGLSTDDTVDHYIRVASPVLPTSSANGYIDITHLSAADISAARWAAADITASGVLRKIHFQAVLAESDVPGAGV